MATTFAQQIRRHVQRLGVIPAARLCGVTPRTIYLWMNGNGSQNTATQVGALSLLSGKRTK